MYICIGIYQYLRVWSGGVNMHKPMNMCARTLSVAVLYLMATHPPAPLQAGSISPSSPAPARPPQCTQSKQKSLISTSRQLERSHISFFTSLSAIDLLVCLVFLSAIISALCCVGGAVRVVSSKVKLSKCLFLNWSRRKITSSLGCSGSSRR